MIQSDYVTGTITLTNGSNAFLGTGTGWLAGGFQEGDTIFDVTGATEYMGVVSEITDNGVGTLTKAWEGPTLTAPYRMRYQPDGSRVTAQARQLIELLGNGNLLSISELNWSSGVQVVAFNGAGSAVLVPKSDLINGVFYNVQVADIAARAAYDAMPGPDGDTPGYSVLVNDVGDGRAAIYSKLSDTSGDWSTAGYVTGPVGPIAILTVAPTITLPPASDPTVNIDPITDGYELTFSLPAGRGPSPQGTYNPANSYVLDDAVLDNGSTWIAIGPVAPGEIPPVLPITSNAQWQLLARKGTDGAGTGDVVGPAVAVANRIAVFDGTTGKLIKDGGKTIAELVPAGYDDLLTTVSLLALQVADNTNATLFLGASGNRIADSFDTLTYVDVAGATNLDSSVTGVLKNTISSGLIPPATGTLVTNFTGNPAASFDGVTIEGAATGARVVGTVAASVATGKDWGVSVTKIIRRFKIYPLTDVGFSNNPSGQNVVYKLQGSTDGSSWVDLYTSASISGLTGVAVQDVNTGITVTTAYRHHRILMTEQNATSSNHSTGLAEVEFYDSATPFTNNLTVRSASFTAASAPTKMKALIRVKEVDAAVAGTDYTLECSRDGGTTWATMTLTELFTSPSPTASIRVVEAAETSVAGQPSGTAPRWRFKTFNDKMIELHDVYLYWS